MKVLFVNTTDERGGAARAAMRLATAMSDAGVEVSFLVSEETGNSPFTRRTARWTGRFPLAANILDRLPVLAYPKGLELVRRLNFSPAARRGDIAREINRSGADIVHLHWVNYGHVSPEGLASIEAPIVWTMHDMWPFTGGCHYSHGCAGYRGRCGACPVLGSHSDDDLSRRLWERKARAWRDKPVTLVAPSSWLADCARSSSLFASARTYVAPNPLDTSRFCPGDRIAARQRLGLPLDAPIVMFGGHHALENPAKGFPLLQDAMRGLAGAAGAEPPRLAIFGSEDSSRRLVDKAIPTHFLGFLGREEDLVAAYRAADVFVAPSIEDNLPSAVCEALACGAPVVGFEVGGIPDMVRDGENGFLAASVDAPALREALTKALEAARQDPDIRLRARQTAERQFAPARVAEAYLEIYRQAIADAQTAAPDEGPRP